MNCPNCNTSNKATAKFCRNCGVPLAGSAPPLPNRLQPGQVLYGRYTVVRSFSKGGMGAIYLVQDADAFGRQRVLKEMLDYVDPADYPDQVTYDQAVRRAAERFEEEARTLAGLKHRGIPDIMAYFSDNGRNYIVMEYVDGVDLERRLTHDNDQGQRVAGQPYLPDDVIRYGIQVCKVLEYLAGLSKPVVHQDIKPANVIVDRAGEVRLVDFGTAKARLAVQPGGKVGLQKSSIYGTVGYAPPEQYQGQSEPRSDVYALAATLYHLLTDDDPRQHPFSFPRVASLPNALWAILDAALQHDVNHRPTSAQLRAQLGALAAPKTAAEPFHLRSGAVARTVAELAAACDQHWEDGKYHLYRRDLEERMRKWGRADLETQTAAIRQQHGNQNMGLDAFLRLLDPAYPLPRIQATPAALDFGIVPWGEKRTVQIEISNAGHGCLQGHVAQKPPWLSVDRVDFITHDRRQMRATVDAGQVAPGPQAQTEWLTLDAGAGGQAQVAVSITVPEPEVLIDVTSLDLGKAYQGETRTGRITVSNQGGSPCQVQVAGTGNWATAAPDSFRCEPGQSVQVAIAVDTSRMGLGVHDERLSVAAEAGSWRRALPLTVAIELPWLKTFVQRYRGGLTVLAVAATILLIIAGVQIQKQISYSSGQAQRAAGQWDAAVAAFERIGAYRDAPTQIVETYYQSGLAYKAAQEWEQSVAAFERAGSYRDAPIQILDTYYQAGLAYQSAQEWDQAVAAFERTGSHQDAPTQILKTHYQAGLAYMIEQQWDKALAALLSVGSYNNANMLLQELYGMGRPIRSPLDGMELALVPAGEFVMGSSDNDPNAQEDEKPQHTVYLDTFWIDRTEVTNGQYRMCIDAEVCGDTIYADLSKSEHPVVGVSWSDALAYCQWAGRHLPTEAEWEKAARGTDGRSYPWGNQTSVETSGNYNGAVAGTEPVGSYPAGASPYGALDMAGNVWEWVADWYSASYYGQSPREDPSGPVSGQVRVLRSGSWYSSDVNVRAANRNWRSPSDRIDSIGFRCAL